MKKKVLTLQTTAGWGIAVLNQNRLLNLCNTNFASGLLLTLILSDRRFFFVFMLITLYKSYSYVP